MAFAVLLIALAVTFALLASVVMSRASNRSALWNMGFAVVLLVLLTAVLFAVAWVVTGIANRR